MEITLTLKEVMAAVGLVACLFPLGLLVAVVAGGHEFSDDLASLWKGWRR